MVLTLPQTVHVWRAITGSYSFIVAPGLSCIWQITGQPMFLRFNHRTCSLFTYWMLKYILEWYWCSSIFWLIHLCQYALNSLRRVTSMFSMISSWPTQTQWLFSKAPGTQKRNYNLEQLLTHHGRGPPGFSLSPQLTCQLIRISTIEIYSKLDMK